jgi:hypothetical protein
MLHNPLWRANQSRRSKRLFHSPEPRHLLEKLEVSISATGSDTRTSAGARADQSGDRLLLTILFSHALSNPHTQEKSCAVNRGGRAAVHELLPPRLSCQPSRSIMH